MIAVDTSSMIAFFQGEEGNDIEIIRDCIEAGNIMLPPLVLTELLSDFGFPREIYEVLTALPLLEIKDGYWERAGNLRAMILAKKLKARVVDTLIAQICLDHDLALITRDSAFKKFAKFTNLRIVNH